MLCGTARPSSDLIGRYGVAPPAAPLPRIRSELFHNVPHASSHTVPPCVTFSSGSGVVPRLGRSCSSPALPCSGAVRGRDRGRPARPVEPPSKGGETGSVEGHGGWGYGFHRPGRSVRAGRVVVRPRGSRRRGGRSRSRLDPPSNRFILPKLKFNLRSSNFSVSHSDA